MTGVKRPPAHLLALGSILMLAAGLRFWGLGFGLPHTGARPDETQVAKTAVDFLSGNLNPGFFNYPTLFMYLTGAGYAVYCGAGVAVGRFASVADCAATWPSSWTPFFLIARAISAAAGTLTVWVVYRLGLRLFDRTAGLAAAMFLGCAFLHVRDSHFGVTDVMMTALVAIAVLALIRAHDRPSTVRFAAAGAMAGLAASTKYNALLLAPGVVVSQGLQWLDRGGPRQFDLRVAAFAAAMAAAFLAGSPYSIVEPVRFWADASSEAAHLATGHSVLLGTGWRYHAAVTLWHGVTWPLLLAAAGGLLWMILAQPRRAALLLSFPLVYYAVAGRGTTVFARYMVPVVPFLCLAAGFLVSRLAAPTARFVSVSRGQAAVGASPPLAAVALTLALATPGLVKSIVLDRLLSMTDSRVLAAEWAAANIPAGSSVYLAGGRYGAPDLSVRGSPPPYFLWEFDEAHGKFDTGTGPTEEWPRWIVVQESPLEVYSRVPSAVRERLDGYDLRHSFRAVDMRTPHVYDQQDAWFLPLAGFDGVGRPGPNVYLYQHRSITNH
jgi:4-amino-4-deoxy-L-arabinose transferase-like glycosyltransferase